ncbi:MAG: phosphoribosylaminoimidazolesuccinocarboxamide synthase [Ruminococcaceae bacterium]|nr:phosphoribosylaminoimidazolesuccinocarboxamide synthase [Oscillospiraceae bacterium]
MEKREQLYEGKAKKVYATNDERFYIVSYKDDATAFNGQKKGTIVGKGVVNNRMSNFMMRLLEQEGVPTHFVEQLSDRETVVHRVEIVPLEVIVRNIAAGSLSQRLGLEEGTPLSCPVLEFCYKNDDLGDPMINNFHIYAMQLATREELAQIEEYAFKVNAFLQKRCAMAGVTLVDFKIEFGRDLSGRIILADEISPDTCRFWDSETGEKLDKDRFRRNLGGVEDAYAEIRRRLMGEE